MKRLLSVLFIFSLLLSLQFGCQSNQSNQTADIDSSNQTLQTYINNQDINYKRIAKDAVKKANSFNIKDKEIWKWTIRVIMNAEIQGENLTDLDIILKADGLVEENKYWFRLAEKYGVNVSEEELRNYIDNIYVQGKDNRQAKEVAEGLGIDIKDLFYSFDANNHKKNLTWTRLKPILEEKYNTKNNNELLEKFQQELYMLYNSSK